jgi:hypothetical protein
MLDKFERRINIGVVLAIEFEERDDNLPLETIVMRSTDSHQRSFQ